MLRGADIVCFANDWNTDPTSKHHLLKRFSEHNAGMDHTGRLWRVLALQVWRQDTLPRMEQLSAAQREYRLSTVTA